MSGKSPYFPNKWKQFKDAPPEMFMRHMFIEVMEGLVHHWEVRPDVACIIRATDLETKKVKEHVYKRQHAAENKVLQLFKARTHEFIICTNDSLHYVHPHDFDGLVDEPFDI
jgi:hypothetical protein